MKREMRNNREATAMSPRVKGCEIHLFLKITQTKTHIHTHTLMHASTHTRTAVCHGTQCYHRTILKALLSLICALKTRKFIISVWNISQRQLRETACTSQTHEGGIIQSAELPWMQQKCELKLFAPSDPSKVRSSQPLTSFGSVTVVGWFVWHFIYFIYIALHLFIFLFYCYFFLLI